MKASFVTIFAAFALSASSYAHGMNKAGPHGGYVRMPGTYHVELVPAGKELKVYFLDMNFAPIPINQASVTLTLNGKKPLKAQCLKEMHFFRCDTNEQSIKNYKEVLLETSKDGETPATSNYKIPLKFM
jgi:hypothetical protein